MKTFEIIATECHRLDAELGDAESQCNLSLAYDSNDLECGDILVGYLLQY